jgi:phage terminase large subunit-like protein
METTAVEKYIKSIESGKETVGYWVRTWYLNHIKPVIEDKDPKYYFDPEASSDFYNFIDDFCLNTSNPRFYGKSLKLLDFQKAKYDCLLGIKSRETDLRRFHRVVDEEGRKNGKTGAVYPLPLYMMVSGGGIQCTCLASKLDQAKILWNMCAKAIQMNPSLEKHLFDVQRFNPSIISTKGSLNLNSTFKPLARDQSKDGGGNDGYEFYVGIIDEIHKATQEQQDSIIQSQSAMDAPILWEMGTCGNKRYSLWDDLRLMCKKVILGIQQDDSLMPILYEADSDDLELIPENERPKKDDPFDITIWGKANPSLGYIKKIESLDEQALMAKNNPNQKIDFLRKDLNIIGQESVGWLSSDLIINHFVYTEEEMKEFDNSTVIGAFDLSKTNDLTAWGTLIFDKKRNQIFLQLQCWCTQDFLDSTYAKEAGVPWQAWIERGFLKISGSHLIDYHDISNHLLGEFKRHGYTFDKICYDPYSANYLIEEIDALGWSKNGCLTPVPQGFKSLNIPMQEAHALLQGKKIVFNDNPMVMWMFSNVELVEDRNGNMMPNKAEDRKCNKIDGFSVLLDCLFAYCQNKDYFLPEGGHDGSAK